MKSAIWKEVIGIKDGSIRENLLNCFDENLSKNSDWNTGWNLDEWILTKSVFESRFYPDNCQNFVRGANRWGIRNGRIDRGAWTQTFNQCMSTKIIDVHLHRDPYVGQIWEDTVTIMRRVFPKNKVEEFINYKQEFVKRLKT